MTILFNILFILSGIGLLIGCGAGDAIGGCCGAPGWVTDEQEMKVMERIRDYIAIPSLILFLLLLFSHSYFGITLLGLF